MGSKYPPGFYDDEAMAVLTQAFREVWKTIITSDPFRDLGMDERLRQTIVRTMMDLTDQGVLGIDELRDRTLAKVGTPHKLAKPPATPRRRPRQAA